MIRPMTEKLKGWRRLRLGNSGAALVEFAITAPVLVVLALGAADFGAIMTNGTSLAGATRAVAELARDTAECVGGGLSNSDCITQINNLVSTLKSTDTSLSSATFSLPGVGTIPVGSPASASANYCTCTDGTVVSCSSGTCSVGSPPDTRVLQYIRVTAQLTVTPLVSYSSIVFPSSPLNAQTTTRIQ
jgi:Flp pilus assembly protein TadG